MSEEFKPNQDHLAICTSVSLPLETKDPSVAVHHLLDLLKSKVTTLDNIKISLSLAAMSFPDILILLAKALPKEAEGFGMDRSISAGQFLKAYASGRLPKVSFCPCDVNVTDYLTISESLSLIESFFNAGVRAIRSTCFTIILDNLQWRGAGGIGSGKLFLFDMKGFRRKRRFSLSAMYSCPGKNSKDKTVRTLFKKIADETEIPFNKGTITETISPESSKQNLNDILTARICFEEAFEQAGREIRNRNVKWLGLPGLASDQDSFNKRMDSVLSGKKESVNFPGMVRRFMKESFSMFTQYRGDSEQILFTKPVSSDLELILGFDRIHSWGLGKTFTLLLGIGITQGPLNGCKWIDKFFRLFQQQKFPPCWTYVTKVELSQAFDGISDLLNSTLDIFEDALTCYLIPIPSKLPDSIPNRGPITAKQGLQEALNAAKEWSQDAELYKVGASGILFLRESGMGPAIDINGCLRPDSCWYYSFYSQTKNRSLFTQVPSLGSLRCDEFAWSQPFGSAGESVFPGPIDKWIDSNQAMDIAEENGGRAARENALCNWDIIAELEVTRDRAAGARIALEQYSDKLPQTVRDGIADIFQHKSTENQSSKLRWTIRYLINKTKNYRKDFQISFNAIDGGDIKLKRL